MYLGKLQEIISDILDVGSDQLNMETDIIKELGAESIDLLEIAVAVNTEFGIDLREDHLFLKNMQLYIQQAEENNENVFDYITGKYCFLSRERIDEIINRISEWPVLKIKDMLCCIEFYHKK